MFRGIYVHEFDDGCIFLQLFQIYHTSPSLNINLKLATLGVKARVIEEKIHSFPLLWDGTNLKCVKICVCVWRFTLISLNYSGGLWPQQGKNVRCLQVPQGLKQRLWVGKRPWENEFSVSQVIWLGASGFGKGSKELRARSISHCKYAQKEGGYRACLGGHVWGKGIQTVAWLQCV